MRMQILAVFSFVLLAVGSSLADNYVYEFGLHNDDPVIYTTTGQLGLFEYEKEIALATSIEPSLEVRYVKVLVTSLSPPKVEYDSKHKKITIKYSWAQAPPLGSKFHIDVQGGPPENKPTFRALYRSHGHA